jgi:hypothetical protein
MRTIASLWYALLAPPLVWAAQELLGWFFGERICGAMSPGAVRLTVLALGIAALAVCLSAGARGWRTWRGVTAAAGPVQTDATDRVEFMALGGFLVGCVFAIAVVWAALSSAFIADCGRMR